MAAPSGFPESVAALPAAASAGVLVSAPAKVPAIWAESMPRAWPSPRPALAARTKKSSMSARGPAAVRRTWKKLGPDWMPMAKVKIASPSVPRGPGIVISTCCEIPQAARAMPAKRTAAAPRLTPRTLIWPTSMPIPMSKKRTRTGFSARCVSSPWVTMIVAFRSCPASARRIVVEMRSCPGSGDAPSPPVRPGGCPDILSSWGLCLMTDQRHSAPRNRRDQAHSLHREFVIPRYGTIGL